MGPNGAGKTTAVECITGLRVPDSGSIRVLGLDPQADRNEVRQRVGVQLQESARFRPRSAVNVPELVESLGLAAHTDAYYRALSGGLKQRLSIALALVGDPEVAVLDELTTGLDPHARQQTWALIESVCGRGVTVVVVTHSMEEAEQLCDRVAVIDHGRLVACGTPAELREQGGGVTRMSFRPSGPFVDRLLTSLPDVTSVHRQGDRVVLTGTDEVVTDVILALNEAGIRARQVSVESSSLEQAFLTLTSEGSPPASTDGAP